MRKRCLSRTMILVVLVDGARCDAILGVPCCRVVDGGRWRLRAMRKRRSEEQGEEVSPDTRKLLREDKSSVCILFA